MRGGEGCVLIVFMCCAGGSLKLRHSLVYLLRPENGNFQLFFYNVLTGEISGIYRGMSATSKFGPQCNMFARLPSQLDASVEQAATAAPPQTGLSKMAVDAKKKGILGGLFGLIGTAASLYGGALRYNLASAANMNNAFLGDLSRISGATGAIVNSMAAPFNSLTQSLAGTKSKPGAMAPGADMSQVFLQMMQQMRGMGPR